MTQIMEEMKRDLLRTYMGETDPNVDSNFWARVMALREGKFSPTYKEYSEERKDVDKTTQRGSSDDTDHKNSTKNEPSALIQSDRRHEAYIRTFVGKIICEAEEEADNEFWRNFEKKLYGKWLRSDDGSDETTDEAWNFGYHRTEDINYTRFSNPVDIRQGCCLYSEIVVIEPIIPGQESRPKDILSWLYRDPKVPTYIRKEQPPTMAKDLQSQLYQGIAANNDIVSIDQEFQGKNKLVNNYGKKMNKRSVMSRVVGFFHHASCCFKRRQV